MKKIAVFLHTFPTYTETFILNDIVYLLKQGHDVRIFSLHKQTILLHPQIKEHALTERWYYEDAPNIIGRFLFSLILLLKNPIKFLSLLNFFKYGRMALNGMTGYLNYHYTKSLGKDKYDVVHAHFGVIGNHVLLLRSMGFFNEAKFVTSFHGSDVVPPIADKKCYKKLFESCDVLLANTEFTKTKLYALGYNRECVHTHKVGVDTKLFTKTKRDLYMENRIRLTFIGRLVEWKGCLILIDIAKSLSKYLPVNFHISVIGDGELYQEMDRLILENDLSLKISLCGNMTQDEVAYILGMTDTLIHPGKVGKNGEEEFQGLVLQEAQACGVPVIAYDVGGVSEGVIDQETGYLVERDRVDMICNWIISFHRNPNIADWMSARAREYIIRNFDMSVLGKKLEKFYFTDVR